MVNSQINESSFGSDVFTDANRNIDIVLWKNINLQTLKESIFGELLHKDPKSTISTHPILTIAVIVILNGFLKEKVN